MGDPAVLYLVGLGPGPVEQATLQAWELLASGKPLLIKDPHHETAETALARGMSFEPLRATDPSAIADEVLSWAETRAPCVYAMPGDPLESPETRPIVIGAQPRGLEVNVVAGLTNSGAMPVRDLVTRSYLTAEAARAGDAFKRLVSVMGRLRSPEGCPWDREQTHASLAVHMLEETYEALDAIDRDDLGELKEELGDLLLQIVFHSEMARQAGEFEIADVVNKLIGKLIHRHPHIFGDVAVRDSEEVVVNWERMKRQEKERTSAHEGIPRNLPALLYAYKIQRRLAGEDTEPASSGLVALAEKTYAEPSERNIGELLFAAVDMARRAEIDPEGALRKRASLARRG